eukprot:scaffold176183_cov27-Tisochrysis_lutea.AAC.3
MQSVDRDLAAKQLDKVPRGRRTNAARTQVASVRNVEGEQAMVADSTRGLAPTCGRGRAARVVSLESGAGRTIFTNVFGRGLPLFKRLNDGQEHSSKAM